MAVKVSIQGYEGSFHQMAARSFFGKEVEVIPCATFREVVKLASNKRDSDGGVMAIENSIAGSILGNYALLQKSDLQITGEVYLQINQNLLVNPDVTLEDIKEVHSHPMALQQCLHFLDKHNWKLVESEDTALSAKQVHRHRSKHIAAIASKLAAELFGLKVLKPNIQDEKDNYTRFLIVQRAEGADAIENANKASINFQVSHTQGALAKVLTVIADEGINLSKLQSFPIPGTQWKYSFHADLEFDSVSQFEKVKEKMLPLTNGIRVFGIYKKGTTIL
ncbi:prephenate dehydratase [Flavisolibacter tropicus]|uniref:Bifunctional chorismate mutase/prephenate dehydratase n=1 Tax=Flavisolibacter tropicus TaxID=1492898 RepID=A0A172TTX4_9BACT|nr:prephenate dehydratase [Flavisolibacter tropicus]ANE50197.1 chorismate mutase [Flavisolibacter tropicus]